jgi:hypothetical protein
VQFVNGVATRLHGTTRAAAIALGLAAATAHLAIAADTSFDAERDGDAIEMRATTLLNTDRATVWRVLTDYNRYSEFIPDLRLSRVVARDGATVTVEQSGDVSIWLFKMPIDITFEINETPPDTLHSRAVAGSLRALTSRYALTPTPSGIRLDYTGRIAPGFEIFGRIEQDTVKQNIARQFQALADEIEKQSAARTHAFKGDCEVSLDPATSPRRDPCRRGFGPIR